MYHSFFGTDPSQLAVSYHLVPKRTKIRADAIERTPDQTITEGLCSRDAQIIAATNGEG